MGWFWTLQSCCAFKYVLLPLKVHHLDALDRTIYFKTATPKAHPAQNKHTQVSSQCQWQSWSSSGKWEEPGILGTVGFSHSWARHTWWDQGDKMQNTPAPLGMTDTFKGEWPGVNHQIAFLPRGLHSYLLWPANFQQLPLKEWFGPHQREHNLVIIAGENSNS